MVSVFLIQAKCEPNEPNPEVGRKTHVKTVLYVFFTQNIIRGILALTDWGEKKKLTWPA